MATTDRRALPPWLRFAAPLLCAAAALLPACEQTSAGCPGRLDPVASLALSYAPIDKGDTCRITRRTDGGPVDAGLAVTPPAAKLSVCAAQSDAGVLSLAVAVGTSGYRTVTIDGGSFSLTSTTGGPGSACICAIELTETLSGTLQRADGGALGFESDGGFTPLSGFGGAIDDSIKAAAGGGPCNCNLPCGIHYALTGVQ